jgi:lysophospholipase
MNVHTIRDRSHSLNLRYATSDHFESASRILVLVNGRSEWLEKYTNVPNDLKIAPDTGFLTFDHRGQGCSGGARAWISHYDTYANDLATIIQATVKDRPFNMLCHSMGSLITVYSAMKGFIKPRCMVLSSPLLGMPNHPVPAATAYKASLLATKLHLGHVHTGGGRFWKPPFEDNILTHSAERYEVIKKCPYPVPSPTFEWVKASYEATKFVNSAENQSKLTMPILVLCGTEEHVIDSSAVQKWAYQASEHSKNKVEFRWIQEGYHELLFEHKPIYDDVIQLIRSWYDRTGFPL